MFYYGFLFQYLHNMIEGRNPLTAYLRACERSFAAQSLTPPVLIKQLRHAWNAFARLLKIDMKSSFQCPICGDSPQVVICDGTMLGFRKDLLESFSISGQCCHVPFSIGLPYTWVNKRMRLFSKLQRNMRLIPNMHLIAKEKLTTPSKPRCPRW